MNFADAIRRAAESTGAALGQPEPRADDALPETEPDMSENNEKSYQPNSAETSHAGHGHVVRLELVLTPEQLKGLFGAVVANQHSVMTLREAATYLRVSHHSLEQLAGNGDVPGMLVDGKWRFTRLGLDDWLNTHSQRKEA